MGGFETKEAAKSGLPTDLPNAAEIARQHPDGAIYRHDNGKRYRLRHARFVEVVARKADDANGAKKPAAAKK